jgi:hypothetical protein
MKPQKNVNALQVIRRAFISNVNEIKSVGMRMDVGVLYKDCELLAKHNKSGKHCRKRERERDAQVLE